MAKRIGARLIGNWPAVIFSAALVLVAVAILAGSLAAQGETEQGWTVWQGGDQRVYAFKNQWRGEASANGFRMQNSRSGVVVHYYGTFRVEYRARAIK